MFITQANQKFKQTHVFLKKSNNKKCDIFIFPTLEKTFKTVEKTCNWLGTV